MRKNACNLKKVEEEGLSKYACNLERITRKDEVSGPLREEK